MIVVVVNAAAACLFAYLFYKFLASLTPNVLDSKTVVLTGASGGLGTEIARNLLKRNCVLCLWDVDATALDTLVKTLSEQTTNVVEGIVVDLSSAEDVDRACQMYLEEHGQAPDILIQNAGVIAGSLFEETSDEKIDLVMKVNVGSHLRTLKRFLPSMRERNSGHIVTVSSAAGFFATPKMVPYATSKFAARGLLEGLRAELDFLGSSIKTTVVCPGPIRTKLFKGFSVPGLAPLEPEYVASRLVDALLYDEVLVTLPAATWFGIMFSAIAPYWMSDIANWPAKNAMKTFDATQANASFALMGTDGRDSPKAKKSKRGRSRSRSKR